MTSMQTMIGFHSILMRLSQDPTSIKELYIDIKRKDKRILDFIKKAEENKCKLYYVESAKLDSLSNYMKHQGLVAFCRKSNIKTVNIEDILDSSSGNPLLLILDEITDPHNFGSCFRTANASGVDAVISPRDRSANITNPVVGKVSCGASDTVPYIPVTNLARTMRLLRDYGITLVGTDGSSSKSIYEIDTKKPMAWVVGSEGKGMRRLTRDTCDEIVKIPMSGNVMSLNAGVATAICLFETVRQRKFSSTL
ncbi:TrmH family RNA methyltransferase [Candidatus Kinetoplastibacterium blastocrithidii TCC012E]|uniref:TrmH family RNA methyltransferase n=1 Tax=Candidatus Kinetoplastidibacterium blastocrithidiae TCC012E TaxID=1208922 RepID=M1LW82_9PROT|nr:23S rRNA (guanosine(2251)-2'-O)-methyltransferase RlmB [Candidatus Kinetoplastibacterium blastocrithidii]AFZ83665.1 23S rRNA (guanosine2251-2'-O)-methyltransferase [Candidatus Kinetoplastibacterium blastocrithidii (ex Strigomonas culicis)]AGF49787.1 TrmH family RNA methyltransferase [Candidatus Kinetoplastibacterium blastocrithidii TCC012E]